MTVYDTSGNGYDGTLSEAGTVSEDGYLRFEGGKLSTPLKTLSYPYTVAFNVACQSQNRQRRIQQLLLSSLGMTDNCRSLDG